MATAIEQIETKPKLNAQELLEILSTPEGRSLMDAASRLQTKSANSDLRPHTPEEITKFYKLAEKDDVDYIRVDSKTRQPLEEAKTFLWRIIAVYPHLLGTCKIKEYGNPSGDIRVTFQIQKYWRKKFVRRAKTATADPALPLGEGDFVEANEPYVEREPSGEIIATGERHLDASDFMAQFKREESDTKED